MSKRGADHQLTKNDVEAGEDDMEQQQDAGPWRGADQSKLKQRVIVRARRKMGDDSVPTAGGISAPAFPAFNFFGTPAATTDGFTGTAATAADAAADKSAPAAADTAASTPAAATAPATDSSAAASTTPTPAPAPITSFSQLAANLNSDTWECPTCETRNKNTHSKCAACETPNPSATTAADTKKDNTGAITSAGFSFPGAGLSFGSAGGAPKFGSGGGGGWNFGSAFGGGGASTSAAATAAAEGSTAAASTPMWSFSSSAFSLPSTSSALSSFSSVAASSSTSSIASFTAPSSSTSAAGSTAADSSVSEQFKDKKAESSGEETDEIVWKGQTKVFVMKKVTLGGESKLERADDDEDGSSGGGGSGGAESKQQPKEEAKEEGKAGEVVDKWVDVGTGELHINRYTTDQHQRRARLIMRADKTHRLVLNVPLLASLASSFQLQADKYVRLASVSVEEGETRVVQYLLRVKGKVEAQQVLDTLKTVTEGVTAEKSSS